MQYEGSQEGARAGRVDFGGLFEDLPRDLIEVGVHVAARVRVDIRAVNGDRADLDYVPDEDQWPETAPLSAANRWALRAHLIKPPPDDATPLESGRYWQRFYLRRAPLVVVGDAAIIFLLHGRVTGFVGAGALPW